MNNRQLPYVRLRAMEPEDLDALYHIENDMQLWGLGTTNVPYSRYTLHDYIANSSGDIYTDRQVRLIIEDQREQVIGIVDLVNFDPRHRRAELGIVIQQPFREQGYAQAALRNVIDYARRVLHLHQLYAIIDTSNTHALGLFSKLNFCYISMLSDWLYNGSTYSNAQLVQLILL